MAEIVVTSLLSHRTKAGLVQVDINGTRVQLDVARWSGRGNVGGRRMFERFTHGLPSND